MIHQARKAQSTYSSAIQIEIDYASVYADCLSQKKSNN